MALTQYAYVYTDPRDCTPFYVGKGTGYRANVHVSSRGSHNLYIRTKLKSLSNKGLSPIITKIETSTEEFALMLEQGLIKIFGRKDLGKGPLLNLTDGGEGTTNFIQTPESNAKRSESLRKFYAVNERHQTQESIDKIKLTKRLNKTGTGKWMNNGERQIKVKPEYQQQHLSDGWFFGTLRKHVTEEYKAKLRDKTKHQWGLVKQSGHTGNLIKVKS